MSEPTYKLKVSCNNCDFNGEIEILKGKKVEDADCPTCGCKELDKVYEQPTIHPQYENFS